MPAKYIRRGVIIWFVPQKKKEKSTLCKYYGEVMYALISDTIKEHRVLACHMHEHAIRTETLVTTDTVF